MLKKEAGSGFYINSFQTTHRLLVVEMHLWCEQVTAPRRDINQSSLEFAVGAVRKKSVKATAPVRAATKEAANYGATE